MDSKRKRTRRAVGRVAIAAVIVMTPAAQGCWDNRLEPRNLPRAEGPPSLPHWYPESPWSEKSGQSQIYIEGKIVFETDKAVIRPGSEKVLRTVLGFLKDHPEVTRLRIEGHTDAKASEDHNQELSARRAVAVGDWLVDHGVENIRLIAVGFGESRPLGPNDLAAGRSDNRRTEFHVAEVNGHPFIIKDPYAGGLPLEVLSLEERKLRAQMAASRLRWPPPRRQFVPTGDVVKPVDPKPSNEMQFLPPDAAKPGATEPSKSDEPAKGAPPKGGG